MDHRRKVITTSKPLILSAKFLGMYQDAENYPFKSLMDFVDNNRQIKIYDCDVEDVNNLFIYISRWSPEHLTSFFKINMPWLHDYLTQVDIQDTCWDLDNFLRRYPDLYSYARMVHYPFAPQYEEELTF